MSMKNPPAFPCQFLGINRGALSYEDTDNQEGMMLRDYFAAHALQGMLCNGFMPDQVSSSKTPFRYQVAAYQLADAMLEARRS